MTETLWRRLRFRILAQGDGADDLDPRPITFPPPGPYWVTGYGEENDRDFAVIVAFFPTGGALANYWPDADLDWYGADDQPRAELTFTDRFPRPEWWAAQ